MSWGITLKLNREPNCGRLARTLIGEQLAGEVDPPVLADAKLIVSELVNNAYEHGTGAIELRVRLLDDRLRVEVVDEGQGASIRVREESLRGGGRGLRIVQTLSGDWGVFEGTTHVWAELDIQTGDGSDSPL